MTDTDATPSVDTDARDDSEFATLLYGGETVDASVRIDGGHLVATSHRLLVYTPDAEGRTLEGIQRPNVEGVRVSASGRDSYVSSALKAILFGGLLAGVGAVLPVDGLAGVPPSASGASATGIGGTVALLGDLLAVIALLDDMLRVMGALALLVGVALLGLYLNSRTREVVVSVAGEGDHSVPAADVAEADVERLGREFGTEDTQSWPSFRRSWPR